MERSFFCVGNLGSEPAVNQSSVMPVSAATFYTADMSPQFQDCYFYIEFYSDAAGTTAVTPTAGTITQQGAPYKNSWLYSPDATSISATSVIANTSNAVVVQSLRIMISSR